MTDIQDNDKPIVRYSKKNSHILVRYNKLINLLNKKRLEYRKNGICDQYIKFGTPSIEEVVKSMEKKTNDEDRRLHKLIKCLRKKNLSYDQNVKSYREYITYGGNLKKIIDDGETEWFLINKTQYNDILKKCKNEDNAKSHAINKYISKNGVDKYINRIKKKEMTICIY